MKIKVKDEKGKNVSILIKEPNQALINKAQIYVSGKMREIIKMPKDERPLTKEEMYNFMVEQGMWSQEKEDRLVELARLIANGEDQLRRGGKTKEGEDFSLDQAKELALNMKKWRIEQLALAIELRSNDQATFEAYLDSCRFDYLIVNCVFDSKGNKYFENIEDYQARYDNSDCQEITNEFNKMLYGAFDFENNPENKFLEKYNLVDKVEQNTVEEEKIEFVEFK